MSRRWRRPCRRSTACDDVRDVVGSRISDGSAAERRQLSGAVEDEGEPARVHLEPRAGEPSRAENSARPKPPDLLEVQSTLVSGGRASAGRSQLSNPSTATSSGTRRPRSRSGPSLPGPLVTAAEDGVDVGVLVEQPRPRRVPTPPTTSRTAPHRRAGARRRPARPDPLGDHGRRVARVARDVGDPTAPQASRCSIARRPAATLSATIERSADPRRCVV